MKVCLITGSSKGIGLGIAKTLANLGHQVILNSRHEIPREVIDEFAACEIPVDTVIGDVSDFDQVKVMMDTIKERYGRIDVLVNNAGVTRDGLLMRMSEADWDQVINTNLKGSFNTIRHVTPIMLKQREGTIINMSSVVGIMGNAGQVNYAASKAGLIGLTKATARELASRNITVNAIAPGFIETDMTEVLSDKVKQTMLDQIPLRRFGCIDEVASLVAYLINQQYITGQVIEINGGLHI